MIARIKPYIADIDIAAPPSKSYAHRLMIAAALGDKAVRIKRVGTSADIEATARCLTALGASVTLDCGDAEVVGVFKNKPPKSATLDCGESGSTLRFLMPIAAALKVGAEFKGTGKLLLRPNEILFGLLKSHGVKVDGYNISGGLISGDFEVDASVSSQYVTGLAFALPLLDGDSRIIMKGKSVSANYINITLEVLAAAGIKYEKSGAEIKIFGNQRYNLPSGTVCEGDWSGAAYPLVIGALCGRAKVGGLKVNSAQGDERITEILAAAGANITVEGDGATATKSELNGFKANIDDCPDLAPAISVLAAAANGESEIYGVSRLKIKESDRLLAICDMLKTAGVKYSLSEDGNTLKILGGDTRGGKFFGYSDHRIVMAATALAIRSRGESVVTDAGATAKSYPEFFKDINGGENVALER